MTGEFDGWRALLQGKDWPIHENEPLSGFWRSKDAPVAIWRESGEVMCLIAGEAADVARAWPWCARRPVTQNDYWNAVETGKWPDSITEPVRSNADPVTQISEAIDDLIAAAEQETGGADLIGDRAARDRLANYCTRLVELSREADSHRKLEKEPHLTAGREVDAKWNPVLDKARDKAKAWKGRIGDALKAIAEKAEELGIDVETKAGTRGKTVHLRTVRRTIVDDPKAACAYLLSLEPPPYELIEGIAKAVARLGEVTAIPGTHTEDVTTAA